MPFAEISLPKNYMTEEEKSILAKKVTKILIDTEGLTDNPMARSIALLDVKEFENLYIGGEKADSDKIVVRIYAFSNALGEETSKRLFSEITAAFIGVSERTRALGGRNVWCLIFPLGALEFGVGGMPVTLELVRQLVLA